VISIWVPYAVHIFNVVKLPMLGKKFTLSTTAIVLSGLCFLSWYPLFRWFCLSKLSWLFWSGNLSRVFSSAVIILSTMHLNSSLLRGFSL
jgi:hypothetical protein